MRKCFRLGDVMAVVSLSLRRIATAMLPEGRPKDPPTPGHHRQGQDGNGTKHHRRY